jgi:hypothetical protein
LTAIQPFTKFLAFPSELEGDNFVQQSEFKILVRSFNLNFSYRFGKLDFKNRRSRVARSTTTISKEAAKEISNLYPSGNSICI